MHLSQSATMPPPLPGEKRRRKSTGRYVAAIILLLLTIGFYGAAVGLQSLTIGSPLWPVTVCIVLSLLTGWFIWRPFSRLSGVTSRIVNALLAAVAACGLYLFAFYGINMLTARNTAPHSVEVRIEKLYTETRYHSKRVRRNRYTRGEPYQVYFMQVGLPDGRSKKLSLTVDEYRRYQRRDTLNISVSRGLFGMDVIDRDSY